jgi:hypothetical protein
VLVRGSKFITKGNEGNEEDTFLGKSAGQLAAFECSFPGAIIADGPIMPVMRKLFWLAIAASLLGSGCATRTTVTEDQRAVVPPAEELPRQAEVGMTREEIERIYGRPKRVFLTQNGETWHYDNTAKLWIPFNYGYRYRQSTFVFDRTGHLKTFRIDQ